MARPSVEHRIIERSGYEVPNAVRSMESRDPHLRMFCALEPRMARMGLFSLSAYIRVLRG
jgi:hypothetical protein